MNKHINILLIVFLLISISTYGRADIPEDFAYGLKIETDENGAIFETIIPKIVYEKITNPCLSDIAVFNGNGERVPFIVSRQKEKVEKTDEVIDVNFFPVWFTEERYSEKNLKFKMDKDGTLLEVRSPEEKDQTRRPSAYILDLNGLENKPSKLKIKFENMAQEFLFEISVFSSNDLSGWKKVSQKHQIANLVFGDQKLFKNIVTLEKFEDKYLKMPWPETAKECRIKKIHAVITKESMVDQKQFVKIARGEIQKEDNSVIFYKSPGYYPVNEIQLLFHEPNSLAFAGISSRNSGTQSWGRSFNALFYNLSVKGITLSNDSYSIPVKAMKDWQVDIKDKETGIGEDVPELLLGWVPHRLTFLGRGQKPFLLVFGSRKQDLSNSNPEPLKKLLLKEKHDENSDMRIKIVQTSDELIELGGEKMLETPAEPIEWRKYGLYSLLVCCLIFVAVMAWKISKEMMLDIQTDPKTK